MTTSMNNKTDFDFYAYVARLAEKNKLARRAGFHNCTCSGINHLEGILQKFRTEKAFVCSSDVTEGSTTQRSGGWMKRRIFTVFILHRFKPGYMEDYEEKMELCRELFRQFQSRMLRDALKFQDEMSQLNLQDIRSRELGGLFLNGCTGLYFMVSMDEPVNLCYDDGEWDD